MKSAACIPPLVMAVLLAPAAQAETPTEQVARQFREYSLHESTDHGARLLDDAELPKTNPDETAQLLAALRQDGSWPDIDYASQARSSWPPCTHLTRVLALTVYARRAGTPPADAARSLAAVHKALAYWKQHDYQCPNWWYNQIGAPKILGDTALLLAADLQPDEKTFITGTVLARAKVGTMTGQNCVWLAANGLMRAALLSDEALLKQAAGVIQEELHAGTGEGIQADASFHQHGAQQQFGNYGMACAVEMSRWATVLRGTPWAFPDEKMAILRHFLLEGENWVAFRGVMDISACGRQLFPGSPAGKAAVIGGVMRTMAVADAPQSREYQAFSARNKADAANDLVGDRMFWRSDYLVHREPQWMATLKMSSARVIGGETVNKENLAGLHLADGATFFYRTGHEYEDIFPAWDWRMIPGTTVALSNQSLTWPATPDLKRSTEFVGGVSDGVASAAAMDFSRDDLHARKAWFFTPEAIICLGADIRATGPSNIATTLNQCLLTSAVTLQRGGKRETAQGTNQQFKDAEWIEQGGFRYTLLQPVSLKLSAAQRTGNWRTVFDSPATPAADVSRQVFTLSIDHGTRPDGDAYAYAVSLADAAPQVMVIANTPDLQAVKTTSAGSSIAAAVFWSAGTITLDGTPVQADSPCLVLLRGNRVTVSDPTQKLKTLRLRVGDKWTTVTLPQGANAGQSTNAS